MRRIDPSQVREAVATGLVTLMRLSLSFLGPFQTNLDSSSAKGFESDRVRALLAYLVMEAGRPHRRDALAALLWPEQRQELALKNLRHILYKLRQVLDGTGDDEAGTTPESTQSPYLVVTTQTVQFDATGDFQLDVDEFTRLVEAPRTHQHRRLGVCGSCNLKMAHAVRLYRGEFLEGFGLADSTEFDEWLLLTREALHQKAVYALTHLAAYSQARSDYQQAESYARKQLELEPWNEDAHRHLVHLLWMTGQRSAAIAQYQACRRVLAEELGIEPSPETDALYKLVRAGDYNEQDAQNGPAASNQRHNLQRATTPFVGRKEELAGLAARLESGDRRLLTLVGPGGTGKSRVALQAAADHVGLFEDGVYFVPLAPVAREEGSQAIVAAIAQAISLHFTEKLDDEAQLLQYLSSGYGGSSMPDGSSGSGGSPGRGLSGVSNGSGRAGKEILLVIDNFEHLLANVAIVRKIIERAPRVTLLVNSRERLNLQAESVIEIAGLDFPPLSDERPEPIPLQEAAAYSAVQLFVERAQAVHQGFRLTEEAAPSVVRICRIVEGLPLAVELAAAQVQDFSSEEISHAIQANLDFLATDQADVPLAHSSMRAVFSYSWSLLAAQEKALFSKLSVFRGGWESEAAELVAGATRPLLRSLAGKSLIKRAEQENEARYSIHELLRQYAAEQLDDMPEEEASTLESHAHYYLGVAEAAEPNLRGPEQEKWLRRLDQEHANLQAAIRWAAENRQREEIGLRLVGALWQFWVMHAHYATGRTLLSTFDLQHPQPTPVWAKVLFGAGRVAVQQGDQAAAHSLMEQSMDIYKDLGDDASYLQVMIERARAYSRQGNYTRCEELATPALEMARAAGNLPVMASALTHLGAAAVNQGRYAEARPLYAECLQVEREIGDKWGIAWTLTNLGVLAHYEGDIESGRKRFEESLAIRREIGDKWGIATCTNLLGILNIDEGLYTEARRYITQALAMRYDLGDAWAISESYIYVGLLEYFEQNFRQALEKWLHALSLTHAQQNRFLSAYILTGLAAVALRMGQLSHAATMLGTVSTFLEVLNVHLAPTFLRLYDEVLTTTPALLGEEKWSLAWSAGTNMTLDAVYQVARRV
ncbi:MAG: tetratricopeptide repeat protein [Chloroflexota bacterium]|nr:tetratricopeptide repeat protein [Chloroflexota bacterium]